MLQSIHFITSVAVISYTKDCGSCKVVVGYIFVNHFVIKAAYQMRTPTDEERLMSV